jgi:hypothetical protein
VFELEDAVAECPSDALGDLLELPRPRRIRLDHGDRGGVRATAHPRVVVRVGVVVPRDLLERRHRRQVRDP